MIPLWRVTDQQILAAAGLDAYVFLKFFRMASSYLAVVLFFALVVIKPVHDANPDDTKDSKKKHDSNGTTSLYPRQTIHIFGHDTSMPEWETDYLWMYLVFVYFFSIFAMYIIVSNTRQVIEVRQEYLGTQTTVTDRTIRLSGIPKDLQAQKTFLKRKLAHTFAKCSKAHLNGPSLQKDFIKILLFSRRCLIALIFVL